MKDLIINILDRYFVLYSNEVNRLEKFKDFINNSTDEELSDWNNFNGHIVASAFIYAKNEKKLLLVYHNDFNMYVYPGGHMEFDDNTPLEAAIREIKEETGLDNLEQVVIGDDILVPIDIDIHNIEYNEKLDLPRHYHFDFRYLFVVDDIKDITLDSEELSDYKWVSIKDVEDKFGGVLDKVKRIVNL